MARSHDTYDNPNASLDENSALLAASQKKVPLKATPLPIAQLLILAAVRLAEPISYTQIFPYVNEMMERLHVTDDPANIGYYSGLVDSCFAIAQLLTIYQWSKWSDHIGRKPIIIIGLTGVALSSFFFGLSKSLVGALISRSLAGMLSGNMAVVSSMLSEMTDSTNQGKAFSLFGATWAIGCVIGPIIGGNLSRPAERYPAIFGQYQFLRDYPYVLPCAISSFVTLLSILLCLFFVDETLPKLVEARKVREKEVLSSASTSLYGSISSTPVASRAHSPTPSDTSTLADDLAHVVRAPSPSSLNEASSNYDNVGAISLCEMLSYPTVRLILVSSFMLSFLSMAFDVVFVLFTYTRVELGGMGRSPQEIGLTLSASGMMGVIGSLFIFPRLQRTFNNRKMYTILMSMWILAFLFAPISSGIVRLSKGKPVVLWLAIVFLLTPVRVGVLNFPLNMILVKSSAPSKQMLSSMFGLQQTMGAFARAVSPAFVSSLYAFSADHPEILCGNLVWLVMIVLAIYGAYVSSQVEDVEAAPTGHKAIQTRTIHDA